jgi:hypothetical protein
MEECPLLLDRARPGGGFRRDRAVKRTECVVGWRRSSEAALGSDHADTKARPQELEDGGRRVARVSPSTRHEDASQRAAACRGSSTTAHLPLRSDLCATTRVNQSGAADLRRRPLPEMTRGFAAGIPPAPLCQRGEENWDRRRLAGIRGFAAGIPFLIKISSPTARLLTRRLGNRTTI